MTDGQVVADVETVVSGVTTTDAVASVLLDLLAIDTQNPPGETVDIADYVESVFATSGIEYERIATDPVKPNVVATIDGKRDESLLFNGHFDTVPFDETNWEYDPLGERADDRIYGRGATDMKGPLAAMLVVAQAFATGDGVPPLDLQFAFVSDEEVAGDGLGLRSVLDAGKLDSDACIIGENTCEGDRHSVTVADKGSIWLTIEAEGESAHGSRPALGTNAIDRLYEAITDLRDSLVDREFTLDDRLDQVIEESVAFYAPTMGESTARRLFQYPSVNLGTFDGGTAINAVPDSAEARLDVRVTASVDTEEILSDIRNRLADHEGVSIADVSWSVGSFEDPDGPLASAVADTASAVVDDHVYRRSATGGGDAKTLRNAGIPTVEFALGTETAHAVDEYIPIDALRWNAEIYARVPYELGTRYDAVGR